MKAFRDVTSEDSDMLFEWRNKPEVSAYMYTDHAITRSEHDAWFSRMADNQTRRYWILVVDGRDVGLVNLADIDMHDQRCSWAFYIAESELRGRGVGAFAEFEALRYVFEELKLNKLCCEVLGFNAAVQKMHGRFGFTHEGTLRQHRIKNGEFHDVEVFGMLRDEWEQNRNELEADLKRKRVFE